MKVLHVLYQSLPQISGSSIRTRDILMSQKSVGVEVIAITAPFQKSNFSEEIINDVLYKRTSLSEKDTITDKPRGLFNRLLRFLKIIPFILSINKIVREEKPDILHAHAMFFCGLPTLLLGKLYKIPTVYEIRSMWMLNKVKRAKKGKFDLFLENFLFSVEKFVISKVDVVVVINKNLKSELIKRKVKASNIVIINNAVNTLLIDDNKLKFEKREKESKLVVFGYIGTLTPHEGIPWLIDVFNEFVKINKEVRLMIYGTGYQSLLIKELCKDNYAVNYMGSIAPDQVYKAFSEIDIIVNPRVKNDLTDTVTPLKPLEAMAYEKLFIGSDVGGIKELVEDEFNGLLFEADNEYNLINTLTKALEMSEKDKRVIIKRAYNYAKENKSWLKNAYIYKELYNNLIEKTISHDK